MITYKDINVGDTVITKYGTSGVIVNISGISYLNHKNKMSRMELYEKTIYKYVHNDKRTPGLLYNVITFVHNNNLVACDLDDVKSIIKADTPQPLTFKQKIKNLFTKILQKKMLSLQISIAPLSLIIV